LSQRAPFEIVSTALVLLLILNLLFFPAIWGHKTLLSSARGTASILPSGAYEAQPALWLSPPKSNDPGAVAWFAEPNYALLHDQILRNHQVPLWNPYCGCGVPWLANMQSQVLNPLQILAWLSPSPRMVDLYLLTRLFVAGMLMFLFLRQLLSFIPAVYGAIAYMLTGYLVIYIGMPDISVCAYIPGLFWAAERLVRYQRLLNVGLFSVFLSLMIFAGMPEIALLTFVFLALYLLCRLLALKPSRSQVLTILSRFAAAGALAALLAAPQWLSFIEYMQQSFNAHEVAVGDMPGVAYNPRFFLHLLNYLVPLIYGPLMRPGLQHLPQYFGFVGYWGTITSFLALLAVCTLIFRFLQRRTDQREIDVLALVSTLGFLFLLAKRFAFPLVQWIGTVPLLRMVVFWKYSEPLIAFCICTLAAIALYWISVRSVTTKIVCLAFAALAIVYSLLVATNSAEVVSHHYYFRVAVPSFLFATAAFFVSFSCARQPRKFSRLAPYIVAFACLELSCNFIIPTYYKFSRFAPASVNPYAGAPFVKELLKSNTNYQRIFSYDGVLYPDWASAFRLYDIRDLDAMYPVRFLPFLRMFAYDSPKSLPLEETNLTTRFTGLEPRLDPVLAKERTPSILRLWQLTSTGYILATGAHALPSPLEPVHDGQVSIYHVPRVLPRASLFYRVDVAADDVDALHKIASPDFDLWKAAALERNELSQDWLKQLDSINGNGQAGETVEAATIQEYSPLFVRVEVDARHPGLLMLNDTLVPGWNAYVDGKPQSLVHANYLFRGTFIAAGKHTVAYKYEPTSFRWGLLGSAAAVLIFAIWALICRSSGTTK